MMKFNLDETVFYQGDIMKVWDYSPRTKTYILKKLNHEEDKYFTVIIIFYA